MNFLEFQFHHNTNLSKLKFLDEIEVVVVLVDEIKASSDEVDIMAEEVKISKLNLALIRLTDIRNLARDSK